MIKRLALNITLNFKELFFKLLFSGKINNSILYNSFHIIVLKYYRSSLPTERHVDLKLKNTLGCYRNKIMKRCLIEDIDKNLDSFEKKIRAEFANSARNSTTMYKNSIWYKSLQDAEKTCLKEDKIKKIHYKFEDGKEMVEEYNIDTEVLLRRAWKVKGKLGGEGKWDVEVGDPIPDGTPNVEVADFMESKDQPQLTRRNTRINLEWRIRNLPYPIETYSISANKEEKCIVIRTTNKKYFKKLQVPELERLNIPLEQANIQSSHKYNTLIVMYKKPQLLLDMEKEWYAELKMVKPIKDVPDNCKAQ